MSTENRFIDKISNEQTALLPAIEFRGEIRIVEDERDIAAACKYLAEQPVIGFDTETRPSFRPGVTFRVSLLQLSSPEVCYLFRLNRIPLDKAILQLFENKRLLKVGADVAGDLRSLRQPATSATPDSSTCRPSPPNGASPRRASASSRPSCSGNASRRPSG